MKNQILFFLVLIAALTVNPAQCVAQSTSLIAFPGADGYGKYTSGGRGGEVCYVTRLDDCTDDNLVKGTLRWALRHANGGKPRTVLFKVSGTIYLTSKLKLAYPNVSILGQSAPGGGICLAGYNMYICKDNVIVRYMRFRAGDIPNTSMTGLDMENCKNIILDHCSITWSMEECLTAYDTDNTTVQWCIVGEALYSSKNAKGDRAYAMQWGGEHSTMHHTLVTNSHSRAPRFNGVRSPSTNKGEHDYQVDSEFANNVVFNGGSAYGGEYDKNKVEVAAWTNTDLGYNRVYMINNYYRPGSCTIGCNNNKFVAPSTPYGQWYLSGNKFDTSVWPAAKTELEAKNADNYRNLGIADACKLKTIPYELSGLTYETADKAFGNVTTKAGASLPRYDEVDRRLLDEASGKVSPKFHGSTLPSQLGIIDSPDDITLENHDTYLAEGSTYFNYPFLGMAEGDKYAKDSDGDGLPDSYEIEVGLNPDDAADGAATASNGYTNLENYLNAIADGTINKSKYETLASPDVQGTQKLLGTDYEGNTVAGYFVGGIYYEAGKTYVLPDGAKLTPVVAITFSEKDIPSSVVVSGSSVTMPSVKKDGYYLKGWSDGKNIYEVGQSVVFTSCAMLTAVWERESGLVERCIYSTDFQDWLNVSNSTNVTTREFTTKYSNETLKFSVCEVNVNPLGTNTKLTQPCVTKGYAMSAKTATPYIETSPLASVTSVTFVHGATGSNRGWGLKVKGDGDADWVVVSKAVANPASGQSVTVKVNRTNCQLHFFNLTSDQYAFMTSLSINGKVMIDTPTFAFATAVSPANAGTVTQTPTDTQFEADAKVTVTATPNSNYLFANWTDAEGNIVSTSPTYTHTVTEATTLTANFRTYDDYAYIFENCKPYDAVVEDVNGLKVALSAASKRSGSARYRIFLRNGVYDLGSTAKTAIPQSTSLIGESQEGVIVMNTAPQVSSNYQDLTPTLYIDSNQDNVYLQDLTIRQARDWDAKKSNGQCLAMRQRGKRAIYKNVTMQGVQDTYYLNKSDASAYFETCNLAGEVDFIYGDGAMFFEQCKLQPVSSAACITAPNTPAGNKGIVFNDCVIEQEPSAKANAAGYRLGRPWSDSPCVTYINTTMKILPAATGWGSMTNGLVCRFHEYGSKDADGNLLNLSSRSIAACAAASGSDACVISADAAAEYTIANTFASCAAGWTPAEKARQLAAPTPVFDTAINALTWTAVEGAYCYAIVKDGAVIAFTESTTYTFSDLAATYQIRVANSMGGLGKASSGVSPSTSGITVVVNDDSPVSHPAYYNLSGQRVSSSHRGLVIYRGKKIVNK